MHSRCNVPVHVFQDCPGAIACILVHQSRVTGDVWTALKASKHSSEKRRVAVLHHLSIIRAAAGWSCTFQVSIPGALEEGASILVP